MSNFDLGTKSAFKEELTLLLNENGLSFSENNLIDSLTYKIKMKGKDKKKVTDEFLLDIVSRGFEFYIGSNWLVIW